MIQVGVRCEKMPEKCGDGAKEGVNGEMAVTKVDVAFDNGNERTTEVCYKHPLMTYESEELAKKEYTAQRSGGKMQGVLTATEALDVMSKYLTVNKVQLFSTRRRLVKWDVSTAPEVECYRLVKESGRSIYEGLIQGVKDAVNRLVYTWRDVMRELSCK